MAKTEKKTAPPREYASEERPTNGRAEGPAHRLCGPETRGQARSATDAGRALDKVRDEMAAAKGANAQAVRAIGEMLTEWLLKHPEDEGKVMQPDKTLDGCYFEMEKYARAHKTGSSYCMTPDEAFGRILGYYGISADGATAPAIPAGANSAAPAPGDAKPPAEPDPFDLDALLASGPAGLSPSDPEDSPGETRGQAPCATDAGRELGGAL